MTERNPPVWMQSGTYNAVDDRLVTGLLSDRDTGADGNTSGITGGVIPGFSQLRATCPGNTMQVSITAGAVIIPAPGATPPGAYICYNSGASTFTLDIAAGGNPRLDVIYAEVEDQTTGAPESLWRFGVKKGQPSASPTTPTLLAGQFPLASVRVVPASQNGGQNKVTDAQLKDLRVFNAAMGGVHLTQSGTPNPAHQPGRLTYNADSDYLYISNGRDWNYFLTYQAWMNIFESLRPGHASGGAGTIQTGGGPQNDWDPTPTTTGPSKGSIPAIAVTKMQSPSGIFKVSISAFGRTADVDGSGHMSVRVLNGSHTEQAPSTGWHAIGFYMKAWEHHGTTFMVTGMPKKTDLTFRLEFYRTGQAANTVSFQHPYILVEPVL